MDTHIPDPVRDVTSPFMMTIEDVFTIAGRGTVVTGRVERGTLVPGSTVELLGLGGDPRAIVVTSIQSFHKERKEARAGENVGLLLRGVGRDEIVRGQVLVVPGSVVAYRQGEAELYVLSAREGGRKKPFATGYRPQFFFGATDVTGTVHLVGEKQLADPGGRTQVRFELQYPVALEPGMRFALREGSRTIGAGVVVAVT